MALLIGKPTASSGMTKAIYDAMCEVLEPGLEGLEEDKKVPIRENWKNISFAVASGVVQHLLSNLEVVGVTCRGDIAASVSGNTGVAAPTHMHTVNLTGTQSNVVFTQNNDGVGRVR